MKHSHVPAITDEFFNPLAFPIFAVVNSGSELVYTQPWVSVSINKKAYIPARVLFHQLLAVFFALDNL
jgi:hypothetical protein